MPADRLLNTVLQYYQDVHDGPKTEQIIGTTTHLLTQLSNPLNLGVLTSQLLTARAIWHRPDGLRTAVRIISIYNTAALRVYEHEHEHERDVDQKTPVLQPREFGGLQCDEWTKAVVKGADERSQRWKHLLVLTGVLMGTENEGRRALSRSLRSTLEGAVVTAANLALQDHLFDGGIAAGSIVLALNFAFPLLSEHHRAQIHCNSLLPLTIWAITGEEGFDNGSFLEHIGRETTESVGSILEWPSASPSFHLMQSMAQKPLMGNLGPLSKLAGFAILNASDTRAVFDAQDQLLAFSQKIWETWSRSLLCDVDPAFEGSRLGQETLRTTWPALWQTFKKLLFGVSSILQAVVSRSLLDPHMYNDVTAPGIAVKSMHILRNLYFISARDGNSSFQVYTFAYMTSIDVVSRYAAASEIFLNEIKPRESSLPTRQAQRMLDLFYLNLAEHLPLTLSTAACDDLIVKPALVYISHDSALTPSMVQLFEAAHSAVLSVMSCPQHGPLTIRVAPFYIIKLFESFPTLISPRQFRMAFKTVMQIVSPPFPIAAQEPHMSETLLEMLCMQMVNADTAPLPENIMAQDPAYQASGEELSQQSAIVLALIDSLPFLPLPLVEEWLSGAAESLHAIEDPRLREPVKKRFLDMLVSGEMDVERAAIGVAWWGTKGGRAMVLQGHAQSRPAMMRGALVSEEKASRL